MSSSPTDPRAEEIDPDNVLLHRMNVRRLGGEAIRDSILAAAGTLDTTMYGDSVPAYLSPFAGGHRRPKESGPMDGNRRRSVYLEVRRNYLLPLFMAFDFPPPDTTHGRRSESNVPAQALVMMNDPFIMAQAQAWGERTVDKPAQTAEQRIVDLYLTAFGRPPVGEEVNRAAAFLDRQTENYGLEKDAAMTDPRVWADLCHALFMVKEFIFIR